MSKKPSYKELEQRIEELEKEALMRSQAEEAMLESEEKYRNLFHHSNDGIFLHDFNGNIIDVNQKVLDLFGYTKPEMLAIKISLLHPPEALTKSKWAFETITRHGFVNFEIDFTKKNGDVFSSEVSSSLFKIGGKQVVQGIVRDITDRKKGEEALQESEKKYRSFIDNAPVAMYTLNEKAQFTYGNKKLLEITGYKTEDWLNKTFHPIVHPDDLDDLVTRVMDRLAGKGKSDPYEVRIFSSSGEIMWVKLTAQSIYDTDEKGDKNVVGIQTFLEDITDKRLAEDALRESEEKYRTVLENIEDGYYEVDIAGNFTFFNDAMCKILRYPKDELMGMNNIEYMDKKNAKKIYQAFNEVYRTGIPTKALDWELIRKDGAECFVETVVSLIKDSDGQPIGFRGIARDVTERKWAEREKKQLEAQLYQAERIESLGTLAGGIAHDFNNLLMGIQGRTSLMLMGIDSSHPHFEHIQSVEDCIKSAADLTKQLLGFARAGKYEVKTTDINALIKKQNQMFGRTRKEINIQERLDKNIWTADVDQGQIEQVLLNLYVNAWQAMPGGGNLQIQTENDIIGENFDKPYPVNPGKYIKILVTDTGVGIDESIQRRIFEPFFTTKGIGRGTGLGLASAYGIIKNHSGYIDIYSKKGKGTTFEIYLPASEKDVVKEEELREQVLRGTETILFVDDEYIVIDVGQQILKTLGYEVFLARSGKEAIETYRKNQDKIDMVILDMIMPEMGGADTYDKLIKINPDIKVLLSSGYSINGQATEILERGCDGFIQKPFNMADLSKKMREILDKD